MHRLLPCLFLLPTLGHARADALSACAEGWSGDLCDVQEETFEWDANGYLAFCPCMGRIGNQLEYTLQAFDLALATGRTLILPHFIDWDAHPTRFPAFDDWYDVAHVRKSMPNALTWPQFLGHFGHRWPPSERRAYCEIRPGSHRAAKGNTTCADLGVVGQPGSYWHRIGVRFGGGEVRRKYSRQSAPQLPPAEHPVVVMTSAGFRFPAPLDTLARQSLLQWAEPVRTQARALITASVPDGDTFVAVHIRAGSDFRGACEREQVASTFAGTGTGSKDLERFFEARMCGGRGYLLAPSMCVPAKEDYVAGVQGALHLTGSCHVFIATDLRPRELKRYISSELLQVPPQRASDCDKISIFQAPAMKSVGKGTRARRSPDPRVDLATMALGAHFIGNCVSSFTAAVVRERTHLHELPVGTYSYWGEARATRTADARSATGKLSGASSGTQGGGGDSQAEL